MLEYLGGGSLNSILNDNQAKPGIAQMLFSKPSFTYASLLSKARDIADALDYLHSGIHGEASIIHRDLKPDNVGFTSEVFTHSLTHSLNHSLTHSLTHSGYIKIIRLWSVHMC